MFIVTKSRFFVFSSIFLVAALLLAVLVLTASASDLVRVPTDGEVPFYARFGTDETFSDSGWTSVIFYRPPECIPADFNLMEFFHLPSDNNPGAFACGPTTTTGTEIWEGEPGSGPAPKRAYLRGMGAVPVWFVETEALEAIVGDGEVTIADLQALDPLTGSAASYYEILHPSQSNDRPIIIYRAAGELDDGGSFVAGASYVNGEGSTRIQVDQ